MVTETTETKQAIKLTKWHFGVQQSRQKRRWKSPHQNERKNNKPKTKKKNEKNGKNAEEKIKASFVEAAL